MNSRADAPLATVEVADVRDWRDAQKEAGLSDKRVNNLLRYLSGPFSKATRNGMLDRNPIAAVESLIVRDSVARKPFTPGKKGEAVIERVPVDRVEVRDLARSICALGWGMRRAV